jgi:hypothetical protein
MVNMNDQAMELWDSQFCSSIDMSSSSDLRERKIYYLMDGSSIRTACALEFEALITLDKFDEELKI